MNCAWLDPSVEHSYVIFPQILWAVFSTGLLGLGGDRRGKGEGPPNQPRAGVSGIGRYVTVRG